MSGDQDYRKALDQLFGEAGAPLKRCVGCGLELQLGHFSSDRSRSDGLAPYCRDCRRAMRDQYRKSEHGRRVEFNYMRSKKGRDRKRRYRQKKKLREKEKE